MKARMLAETDARSLALYARLLLWRSECDQSEAMCSRSLSVDSSNECLAFYVRACLRYASKDFRAAREDFSAVVRIDPDREMGLLALWAIHNVIGGDEAGITEEFRDKTRQLVARSPRLLPKSALHAVEGEHDLALELLAQAIKAAPGTSAEAKVLPQFHFLREHPLFIELTDRAFD
ncbi:hypothetical protein OV287_48215 [Archangium sp. miwbw1]|uniref:Tetratricopeptide repeat protein n=2 Tax=Archangium lansingense TaxID=2995310 RepID=A0ABT4AKN1_9BACT|nr:hypothetical protein [Archangium lansinium]MCY1082257.1 hypothetical protein [Archangium lansinium]